MVLFVLMLLIFLSLFYIYDYYIYMKRLSFWFQIFTKKSCLIDSACKKIKGDSRSLLRIPSRTPSPFPSGRRDSIQSEPGKISQIDTSVFLMYTVVILWSLCLLFAPMFPSLLSSRVLNSAYRFCSSPSRHSSANDYISLRTQFYLL